MKVNAVVVNKMDDCSSCFMGKKSDCNVIIEERAPSEVRALIVEKKAYDIIFSIKDTGRRKGVKGVLEWTSAYFHPLVDGKYAVEFVFPCALAKVVCMLRIRLRDHLSKDNSFSLAKKNGQCPAPLAKIKTAS